MTTNVQDTSIAAYLSIDIPEKERIACDYFVARGQFGATDYELCRDTGMERLTCGATRHGLYQKKILVDSGLKRPTSTGRLAIVWRVLHHGEVAPTPRRPKRKREEWVAIAAQLAEVVGMVPTQMFADPELKANAIAALRVYQTMTEEPTP